jgi:hypothetical protein
MSLFILRVGNLFMAMLSTPEAHQNQGYIKELVCLPPIVHESAYLVISSNSDALAVDFSWVAVNIYR